MSKEYKVTLAVEVNAEDAEEAVDIAMQTFTDLYDDGDLTATITEHEDDHDVAYDITVGRPTRFATEAERLAQHFTDTQL